MSGRRPISGPPCLIAMDLAGPKLRTGPLAPGLALSSCVHARTRSAGWLPGARLADGIRRPDRPTRRRYAVASGAPAMARPPPRRRHPWVARHPRVKRRPMLTNNDQTSKFSWIRVPPPDDLSRDRDRPDRRRYRRPIELGEFADRPQHCAASRRHSTAHPDCSPAPVDPANDTPRIGCTLSEAFDHARAGDTVHLDDGKISQHIISVNPDAIAVRIDRPARAEPKLKAGEGMNLPTRSRRYRPSRTRRCRPGLRR